MGESAHVVVGHHFDMTSSISIGDNTTIAGCNSYLWTHSFVKGSNGKNIARIDGNIIIGSSCYIGANNIICPGVHIGNNVMTGAGTTVSKNLEKRGLYVSSYMRFINYEGEKELAKFGKPIDKIGNLNVYKKN